MINRLTEAQLHRASVYNCALTKKQQREKGYTALYLSAFYFPGEEAESDFMFGLKTTYDQSVYPYGILPKAGLNEIIFRPVTILYGGNGSGKSTALNVIAEKLRLERNSAYNRSRFFQDYVDRCKAAQDERIPKGSRIITSDDVFDMMLDIRSINEGIKVTSTHVPRGFTSTSPCQHGTSGRCGSPAPWRAADTVGRTRLQPTAGEAGPG